MTNPSTGLGLRVERRGIEPRFAECDSAVIPLDHRPGKVSELSRRHSRARGSQIKVGKGITFGGYRANNRMWMRVGFDRLSPPSLECLCGPDYGEFSSGRWSHDGQ